MKCRVLHCQILVFDDTINLLTIESQVHTKSHIAGKRVTVFIRRPTGIVKNDDFLSPTPKLHYDIPYDLRFLPSFSVSNHAQYVIPSAPFELISVSFELERLRQRSPFVDFLMHTHSHRFVCGTSSSSYLLEEMDHVPGFNIN